MADDIRAGRLAEDIMEKHFMFLRNLMNRRSIIVDQLVAERGRHRGPGTFGYKETGN